MIDLSHTGPWDAQWVWAPGRPTAAFERCFFRHDFELDTVGYLKLHLSADSRYKLHINGQLLGVGPAAGDLYHYHYDSFGFDRIIKLNPRKYQLIVEVLSFGKNGPINEMHARGGLMVHGGVFDEQDNLLTPVTTKGGDDSAWKVLDDPTFGIQERGGVTADTKEPFRYYWALGYTEAIDLTKMPEDPLTMSLDDARWTTTQRICPVQKRSDPINDTYAPWMLVPSVIPQPELGQQMFLQVVRHTDNTSRAEWESLIFKGQSVTIPANTHLRVIFDQGQLTTAYPQISFKEGKGASIRMVYAEAFSKDWQKKVRDQAEGQFIEGHSDVVIAGGNTAFYSPMRWQTFRYVELYIDTKDQPLTINQFDSLFHAYPLVRQAQFASDNQLANQLWDLSWHTLRLCCQDHFTDCPYYEQLQYVGDSLIQALVAFNVGGDTLLWRRLLTDMDHSRQHFGLTMSRYPSSHPQFIPTFSLIWVRAVQLYDQHVGDEALVKELYHSMGQVIFWFMKRINDESLFASLEWWQFVDWVPFWNKGGGSHAVQREGDPTIYPSTIMNLFLLDALEAMVQMGPVAGADEYHTQGYRRHADNLREAIIKHCWSEKHGLFADSPNLDQFSEHANLLAVLTGTADEHKCKLICENLFTQTDEHFAYCTMYFQHYFARTMSQLGLTDRVWERLDEWQSFIDVNLTTLPERPDHPDKQARSDCHAWSAWPAYWYVSQVLGVYPAQRAYGVIGIKPNLGRQKQAQGIVPTPHGPVTVQIARENGMFSLAVDTPAGVPCIITMPDGSVTEHAGGTLRLDCKL